MRNKVSLRDLFQDNKKAIESFLNWFRNGEDEWCKYDFEHVVVSLEIGALGVEKYYHFHYGNILDWLEVLGYKIGMRIKNGKYIPAVYFLDSSYPIYHNSGNKDRKVSWNQAVQKAIEHYERN